MKTYKEFILENVGERVFYHATKFETLPYILKEGLTPNIDRKTNWPDNLDAWSRGKVFVTEYFQQAIEYGMMINEKSFPILKILFNPNKLMKDVEGDSDGDYYSTETINGDFKVTIVSDEQRDIYYKLKDSDFIWERLTESTIHNLQQKRLRDEDI